MKKLMSLLLVLVLALSMGTVAFAAGPIQQNTPPKFDVIYKLDDSIQSDENYPVGIVAPDQTFTYNFTAEKVEESTTVTTGQMPAIAPVTVEFKGTGNVPTTATPMVKKQGTVSFEGVVWPGVGVYYYTVTQTVNNKALGVTYSNASHTLKVTVAKDPDASYEQYYVAFVTLTANLGTATDGVTTDKSNGFNNTYTANNLAVTKEVTGNMGDRNKEFEVDVTFRVPTEIDAAQMLSTITYGTESISTTEADWEADDGSNPATKSVTKTIKLKHDGTVTFQNLPADVTYVVKEKDYTNEAGGKYDAAKYSINAAEATVMQDGATSTMDADGESVKIVNNKGINVDTGVLLDSLPYILLLAFVVVGLAVFFVKRRTAREN
ncbi:MAG: FctA domain-containing protein [Eubacteriales bacterium]|nr:FctA domain-containing protein [Eubacteriales bacterium]